MLSTFIRQPFRTGTVVPSSLGLAELMVEDMGLAAAATVVELGPGTGVFTRVIAERVRPDALVLAFEIDGTLARELQQQMPRVRVVNDSAETLGDQLRACGRESADAILSGLPWANFSRELQERLLGAVVAGLRPGAASRPSPMFPRPTSRRADASARCSRRAFRASRRHGSSTATSRRPSSIGA
jgi:phospholipid N-methyltransferase